MSHSGEQSPHEDVPELAPQTTEWIGALRYAADRTAFDLGVSWRLGPDPIERQEVLGLQQLEVRGLYHAVLLDELCRRTFRDRRLAPPSEPDLLGVLSRHAEPDTRYEIEAALRTIPALAPPVVRSGMYDAVRRYPKMTTEPSSSAWIDEIIAREPNIVDEWHEWIWASHRQGAAAEAHESVSDALMRDHGDSSVLYVAAGRLMTALAKVRGT